MNDLLRNPLYTEADLGKPLPDHPLGVSVSLPLWSHVVGYEEGDPTIISKFQSGYPRFFCPPPITRLFETAEREFAQAGGHERCLVFPRLVHAQRCVEFTGAGRAAAWKAHGLGVATFPAELYDRARKFWRYAGECISTRQALHALGEAPAEATEVQGQAANGLIRERIAALAGQEAEDVFLFPSGMAASYAVHRMLTRLFPGRKTAQLDFPYVDVLKVQQSFGAGAHFLPLGPESDYSELAALLAAEPLAGLFCEAPSNPLLRCVDFQALLTLRSKHQPEVPIIVDDTIATVVNADAFRVADAVTTSLTKSFSGAGDVLAGSVVLNRQSPHYAAFSAFMHAHADHELWRGDALALERNSRNFTERVEISSRNALALSEFLREHPAVEEVCYADREGGVGYQFIQRVGGGYGCLLSFTLKNAPATSHRFYDALRTCKGPSLGTDFTLVCPYTLLAHYDELEWAESLGVSRWLIRVSVGLEDTEDLIARFREALEASRLDA